ncbi:hypothetical protein F511_14041 [Dorcoceras hygrometricum]|uniref:Uncharacterized protein n=1 Tax=Dorcoceras hygrometricum TaxID=472368 RepID=A0A2Z7C2C1_9LAMI|nr:hypothetical protein F511_14041 [Dorcoceras hygrometricum]
MFAHNEGSHTREYPCATQGICKYTKDKEQCMTTASNCRQVSQQGFSTRPGFRPANTCPNCPKCLKTAFTRLVLSNTFGQHIAHACSNHVQAFPAPCLELPALVPTHPLKCAMSSMHTALPLVPKLSHIT